MNVWDILLLALLAAAVLLAVIGLRRRRRRGGCSCGCAGCALDCEKRKAVSGNGKKDPDA